MKEMLLQYLVCPSCLPGESALIPRVDRQERDDIVDGTLACPRCGTAFPVIDGVAHLDPSGSCSGGSSKYEQGEVVDSYLWSHYGDLLENEHSTDAYRRWSGLIEKIPGLALDLGGAVGRFTFELAGKSDLAVGLDSSVAFIRTARQLLRQGRMTIRLKEEGRLTREAEIRLPPSWRQGQTEFLVADALRLPFRAQAVATVASLNLVDKVPDPLGHLQEIQRVARAEGAQILVSDPFSWSAEAAPEERWLGGRTDGPFRGHGLDNIGRLLCGGAFVPAWQERERGHVWWKIRTHRNHYELIRSCYLRATR